MFYQFDLKNKETDDFKLSNYETYIFINKIYSYINHEANLIGYFECT